MCKRLSVIIPLPIFLALLLSACVIESEQPDLQSELHIDRSGFTAYYDLTAGVIPTPNNLLFFNNTDGTLSSSTDGTLNIPVVDENDYSDPKVAMNALDGFSTIAPITARFSGKIEPASVDPSTVYVFKVNLSGPASDVTSTVTSVDILPLLYNYHYIATVDSSGTTVAILPLIPLEPQSHYLVALTTGIQSAEGLDSVIPAHYAIAKTPNSLNGTAAESLEPVRLQVNEQERVLREQGIDSSIVLLSWTFSTQSVGDVLSQVQSMASGSSSTGLTILSPPYDTTGNIWGGGPNAAFVYQGTLDVPYYLSAANSPVDTAPLMDYWQGASGENLTAVIPEIPGTTDVPALRSTETIPLLLTVPKTTKPESGWPVVIFQHGITGNRTNMLGVADALALRGFAVVAIDLPLHGLNNTYALYKAGFERTFDLELVVDTDGKPDPSGTHFINLSSLLTSRDNLRQAVADLFALKAALATMDYDPGIDPGFDFNTDEIYFFGHSLGAMVGSVFLALEPTVQDAVLAMPGGGIAKLLDGSANIGPQIAAGLAANGVNKGTADYESFLGAAQTVLDSADPLNYAADVTTNRGVLMYEIIGDMTIPNDVFANAPAGTVPSPTAGTKPLAEVMGLTQISTSQTGGTNLAHLIRFPRYNTSYSHNMIVNSPVVSDPDAKPMQALVADFLFNKGNDVNIPIDLTDIEPVP